MTPEELAAIKARAAAATPGPWRFTDYEGEPYIAGPGVPTDNYVCDFGWHYNGDVPPENPAFIAAARADVPALVAEVERLRQALEDYGRHSEGCSGQYGPSYRCRCGWRDEARALGVGGKEDGAS
jgi:hypothetical protein